MKTEPLESILTELASDDWLEAGIAIRKLVPHGKAATTALPILFQMTFHEKAPIASDSCALIKRLGEHAVPFLCERARDDRPELRATAIWLLMETGLRHSTTTRCVEQSLANRRDDLPIWGVDPDEIIALFRVALNDESLSVAFAAASALEEFGRHEAEAIPIFIAALQNGTQAEKNWAALRLGRIGPIASAAIVDLLRATKSECRHTALAASNALQRIRGPRNQSGDL